MAVGGREQRLRDDPLERGGELHPDLSLLGGREDVDDAVDRARRALRVQGREHEVTGLGRGQRGRDRLEVAHLADEDHVGVLAERAAQRLGESLRVGADLALVHDRGLVLVEELDRVLDRDDVQRPALVDRVDHRRERRRLTGARRAGHEDEAPRLARELEEHLRQAELLGRLDQLRHEAEGGGEAVALEVDVDAEAGDAGDGVREVDLAVDLEPLLLLGREDAIEKVARLLRRKGLEVLERRQLAAHAQQRRRARGDVEVGGVLSGGALEKRVDGERLRRHANRAIGGSCRPL